MVSYKCKLIQNNITLIAVHYHIVSLYKLNMELDYQLRFCFLYIFLIQLRIKRLFYELQRYIVMVYLHDHFFYDFCVFIKLISFYIFHNYWQIVYGSVSHHFVKSIQLELNFLSVENCYKIVSKCLLLLLCNCLFIKELVLRLLNNYILHPQINLIYHLHYLIYENYMHVGVTIIHS